MTYRIEVQHMDGRWHKAEKLAKFVDGAFVYPAFATKAEAEAAIAAAYADVYPDTIRVVASPETSLPRAIRYEVNVDGEGVQYHSRHVDACKRALVIERTWPTARLITVRDTWNARPRLYAHNGAMLDAGAHARAVVVEGHE